MDLLTSTGGSDGGGRYGLPSRQEIATGRRRILVDLLAAVAPRTAACAADALFAEFRTLPGVLAAGPAAHARVLGDQPELIAFLALVRGTFLESLLADLDDTPVLDNMPALIDYLRAAMAHDPHERVRALFLDARNMLLRDELVSSGDTRTTAVYPREIMRRALELGASALILAHNHPSGDAAPSQADIRITRAVADAAQTLDIVLHDHIIVCRGAWTSMREQRMI